jgi:putative ABC transport system permease protein
VIWRDAILLATRSVGRRLGRTVLTMLAVGLAAALLSSLLIATSAARARVLDQVTEGGPLTGIRVDAAAPEPGAVDSDNPPRGAPRSIDKVALRRIAALPGVRSVVPVIVNPVFIVPPAAPATSAHFGRGTQLSNGRVDPYFDSMVGIDLARAGQVPITVVSGRLPTAGSQSEIAVTVGYLRRVGLTQTKAREVVGTDIELGSPRAFIDLTQRRVRGLWTRVQIVGVVAQDAGSGDIVVPIEQASAARAWASSGDDLGFQLPTSPYSALFVVAAGLGRVPDVRQAITRIGFSTSAPETLIAQVQRYLHVVEIVLAGIGFIALAIAGLGISNAMLASVRERRREIGVLKAVGAADRDVRRIFLVEAGMVGFFGGIVGTIVGWSAARLLAAVVNGYLRSQKLQAVQVGLPWQVLLAVVGGATALALIAGTLPAQRAARLPARQGMGDR